MPDAHDSHDGAARAGTRSFAGSFAHRERASRVLPRGVSSTPRASQRPVALSLARAEGARIFDVDGNEYVDFALGYGPLILGHTPKVVRDAIERALASGLRSGSVHAAEVDLAERIARHVPGAGLSAFLSTGTEACQLALRIARAGTGRLPVVKFRCHYHGWSDAIDTAGTPGNDGPSTGGQDPSALEHVVVLDWGDGDALERALRSPVAAVIMEAVAINAGCFAPPAGFLERARALTRASGAMLIFDEVITGFRLGLGGAQALHGVTPDLTVLGKALGAGLPISAVTGPASMMKPMVAGSVSQRGTYNGNPLSTAAAIACVDWLGEHGADVYPRMERYATAIADRARDAARRQGTPVAVNRIGSCVQLLAGDTTIPTLADLPRASREGTLVLAESLIRHGVAPLPRGLMYLSAAHTEVDIERTLAAIDAAFIACAPSLSRAVETERAGRR
ncbi:MAG: aminotransferase class III-fold pyridoxal phosphate-dependent enzyme [Burkholderiales bacterium]|nr:aminotransferase class III-fold pyridoxal phosphate-dependent enzyme [Burkholderiales bacterium]MCE7876823.1 aminotransferase class III-fold pyridoxal phosphate-dependent enzyme [Betaproteobacteria bacterium PRO3]